MESAELLVEQGSCYFIDEFLQNKLINYYFEKEKDWISSTTLLYLDA